MTKLSFRIWQTTITPICFTFSSVLPCNSSLFSNLQLKFYDFVMFREFKVKRRPRMEIKSQSSRWGDRVTGQLSWGIPFITKRFLFSHFGISCPPHWRGKRCLPFGPAAMHLLIKLPCHLKHQFNYFKILSTKNASTSDKSL